MEGSPEEQSRIAAAFGQDGIVPEMCFVEPEKLEEAARAVALGQREAYSVVPPDELKERAGQMFISKR